MSITRFPIRCAAALFSCAIVSTNLHAGTFCAGTAAQFQAALDAAAASAEDDTIRLEAKTIFVPAANHFLYNEAQVSDLVVDGGYGPACANKVIGAKTRLDGSSSLQAAILDVAVGDGTLLRIADLEFVNHVDTGNQGNGALFVNQLSGRVEIEGNRFVGNGGHGGSALQLVGFGTIVVRDNIFSANASRFDVARLGGSRSVGFEFPAQSCTFENNTVVSNSQQGTTPAVELVQCPIGFVVNNIFWMNQGEDVSVVGSANFSGLVRISNNVIDSYTATGFQVQAEDNFLADPLLEPDCSPTSSSPVIDSGSLANQFEANSTDFRNAPRIFGQEIDIGACEWQPLFANGFE